MRIAGGVLIIIVAVINLGAGCGYAFVGTAAEMGGGALEGLGEAGGDAAGAAEMQEGGAVVADVGENMSMYGYFKMALGALEIAAGVVLFVGTAATLAKVTAALEIVNVGLGAAIFIGPNIFSALGIVAAILAFLGAQQIAAVAGGGGGGGTPAPPPMEEPPAPAAEG